MNNEVEFSREELYDLVWTESLISLSRKYAISDNGLRKKCKKLEIPLPDNKYWALIQFGKKPTARIPLKRYPGKPVVILKIRDDNEKDPETIIPPISAIQKEIEADKDVKLAVSDRLINPDPLIIKAKDKLSEKSAWIGSDGIISTPIGFLRFDVTAKLVSRALLFMDALIKAIMSRGHIIELYDGTIRVVVEGEHMHFKISEKLKNVTVNGKYGPRIESIPDGSLVLTLIEHYNHKYWREEKKPLEEQLSRILAYMEWKGKTRKAEHIENERRWAIRREKERIAREIQERKELELKNFKMIFQKAKRHARAEEVRKYADELESWAIKNSKLNIEMLNNIQWIRDKADWYDPFIEAYDELLAEVDRDELIFKKQPLQL